MYLIKFEETEKVSSNLSHLFSDDENKCDKDLKTGLERCSWTSSRVIYCSLKLHQKSVEGGQEVRETERKG